MSQFYLFLKLKFDYAAIRNRRADDVQAIAIRPDGEFIRQAQAAWRGLVSVNGKMVEAENYILPAINRYRQGF
ncbi:MAG: hypothetical protein LBO21_06535 [Synergistaceae bacterium]|nr:hypothetical protein [Synergistaceae bacterium]